MQLDKEKMKDRIEVLEKLVNELIKENPQEDLVVQYMNETGIPYTEDPIDRLNRVLMALHFGESNKSFKE